MRGGYQSIGRLQTDLSYATTYTHLGQKLRPPRQTSYNGVIGAAHFDRKAFSSGADISSGLPTQCTSWSFVVMMNANVRGQSSRNVAWVGKSSPSGIDRFCPGSNRPAKHVLVAPEQARRHSPPYSARRYDVSQCILGNPCRFGY